MSTAINRRGKSRRLKRTCPAQYTKAKNLKEPVQLSTHITYRLITQAKAQKVKEDNSGKLGLQACQHLKYSHQTCHQ